MTLLQQIDAKYDQAIRELNRVIAGRTNTAQARYDRKKALAKGHEPKRYTVGVERIKHELDVERRWVLKGALEALEYILANRNDEQFLDEWIGGMIEDVEAALDQGTEKDS